MEKILGLMAATINGSLDGLELDNTCDVIEKSAVIELLNELMVLVKKGEEELKTKVINGKD